MLQQFRRIQMALSRPPCRRDIRTVCEHREVRDEPHPVALNDERESQWHEHTEDWTGPERDQWVRIGVEDAVRQSPRKQISGSERSAADPATNEMTCFMGECRNAPRHHQQQDEVESANSQSVSTPLSSR